MKTKFFSYLIIAFSLFYSCTKPMQNKVLIIGIDGCRPDALLSASTPNIDKLWKNGAYSFHTKTDDISYSGSCWTGMLTGVWHAKHNVLSNKYLDPNIEEFPHFFNRVKTFNSNLKTYSITHWSPLHTILQNGDADIALDFDSDQKVTNEVVKVLLHNDVDAMFIHLDDVDHSGHSSGFHPENKEYLSTIENADINVGKMISALKKRDHYLNENWLIIISTDHGGSEKTHGKNTPEHTTIFYIVSGKSAAKGKIQTQVNIVDVAVSAMQHLGLDIKDEWNLDGKPIGLIH